MTDGGLIRGNKTLCGYLKELWGFRELVWELAYRDIIIRYRFAIFGLVWAIVRPLLVIAAFSAIFRTILSSSHEDLPYSYFIFCSAPIWIFSSGLAQESTTFLTRSAGLVRRVYFPRMILVIAGISVNFVDFLVGLSLVLAVLVYKGQIIFPNILLLPLVVAWLVLLLFGIGLIISAMNARYRDVLNIVPFLLHLLLIVSPVGYPLKTLPALYQRVLSFNPLTGLLEAARFSLIGQVVPDGLLIVSVSLLTSLIILSFGVWYFRRLEPWINDYI